MVVDAQGIGQWIAGGGGFAGRRRCLPSVGTAASAACTTFFARTLYVGEEGISP